LHANLVDYLDNFPDLIVNGATGSQMAFVRNAETDYNNAQILSAWGNAMVNGLTAFLTHGSMLVMLGAGILLVQQGALDGMLLAVTVLVTLVSYDAIQPLPLAAQQAYLSGQAAQRIMNITDQSEMHPPIRSIVADHGQDVLADKHEALRGLIRLENVTFRYHPDGEKVLDGINLNILPGRKIAVVGPSGAGKTTLARLLLKFWEPESGRILLDGKSYSIWPEQEIRSQIGYSGPDPFFVNGSLRENMELIRPGITDEEIEEVLNLVRGTGG
jgi:ABC-type multidrug transport system fused ATPase/permease subunit